MHMYYSERLFSLNSAELGSLEDKKNAKSKVKYLYINGKFYVKCKLLHL